MKVLTKSYILDVLKTTPLYSFGEFFAGSKQRSTIDELTKVDAVGAVTKHIFKSSTLISEANKKMFEVLGNVMASNTTTMLKKKLYLQALSAHFENVMFNNDDVYSPAVREELLTYVENHFPNKIEINL